MIQPTYQTTKFRTVNISFVYFVTLNFVALCDSENISTAKNFQIYGNLTKLPCNMYMKAYIYNWARIWVLCPYALSIAHTCTHVHLSLCTTHHIQTHTHTHTHTSSDDEEVIKQREEAQLMAQLARRSSDEKKRKKKKSRKHRHSGKHKKKR